MENKKQRSATRWTTTEMTRMALVTGLYVAVTFALSVISFGAIQIRLSEMFNYLSLYNKRYILAVTLGVALANLASPLGLIDVAVGSISTFLVLSVNAAVTKRVKNMKWKMVITALIFSFSMFTVAGQLTILYQAPFFFNWGIIALGELASMTIGGVLVYWIGKKIDLTK
ncbi:MULTISPECIES: QueT transporter family protein [unclassified Enterococcus]|uniref:QueT transporter family protein n=1 Tax=unclassified Enterococcus TaxID=2608891 RepID=UPI0013EE3D9A|nr:MULTISPECIES: QueT transporter family protein [unclassified Enterococcus]